MEWKKDDTMMNILNRLLIHHYGAYPFEIISLGGHNEVDHVVRWIRGRGPCSVFVSEGHHRRTPTISSPKGTDYVGIARGRDEIFEADNAIPFWRTSRSK